MWNKRPEEELTRSFEATPAAAPAGEATNPVEIKKDAGPSLTAHPGRSNPESGSVAVIGKGVKITGEIYSSEDLVIEGFVEGTVEALNQKLTVGPNGTLHATVQVRSLDVKGTVKGNIDACERVDIRNGASLIGDIRAARIVLEDGAYFKGKIDIVMPEPAVKQHAA